MTKNNGLRLVYGLLLALAPTFCIAKAGTIGSDEQSVLASQGGAKVTLADVDAFAVHIPDADRAHFFDSPQRIQSVITSMLLQKQLAAQARSAGLNGDPDVLKASDTAKDAALAKAEMDRFKAAIKIPDLSELAEEEYIANKERYAIPEFLSVKHIAISMKSRSEADAQKLADQVEAEVRKDPSLFDALVEKYSEDPGKTSNHGLITHAGDARVEASFAAAAKALAKPDDISPVVKTSFGFHVLKLIDKAPAQQSSFDQVREKIVSALRTKYVEKTIKEHIDILRNKLIDADPDLVASLRTRYASPSTLPDEIPLRSAKQ